MKIIVKTFLLICILLFNGCAYYNTFFNAKKFFKDAEKERVKSKDNEVSNTAKQKYEKAIEKASKLLSYYPNSKYIDDALFLLGKSFFYREEYQKAKRKFDELINNFPQSEFVPEARLWLGKTNTELRDYETAEKNFQDILKGKAKQEIRDEAQFLLGGLFLHKEDYISALDEYKIAAQNASDKSLRSRAYSKLGECYMIQKDFSAAATNFEKAKKYSQDVKSSFQAQFNAGLARKELKQYDEAISIFLDLLGDIVNEEEWPKCKLQVAECLYQKGESSNAIFWYETITEEHKRTDESAKAYFHLGLIYQRDKADYNQAKEYFDLAVKEYGRSEIVDDAKANSKNVQNLLALKEDIKEQEKRIAAGDSIAASMDSLEVDTTIYVEQLIDSTQLSADSTAFETDTTLVVQDTTFKSQFDREEIFRERNAKTEKTPQKFALKTGELGTPQEELIKDKLMLAEIYLFDFNQPDSALFEYLYVLEKDTIQANTTKAIYSIGYIFQNYKKDSTVADSIYRELINAYPNTIYAEKAREQLNLPSPDKVDKIIKNQFLQAEKQYIDNKNYDLAITQYEKIAENYPDSPFASKALFSIGWIYDKDLHQNDKAKIVYQQLVDNHPKTEYAAVAKKKLDALTQKQTEGEKKRTVNVIDEEQLTDSGEVDEGKISTEISDANNIDKASYRELLRKEMSKDNRRMKYPRRIIK